MRLGNYEILRRNQWCYQVYKVSPDGYKGKAKTIKSPIDARPLISTECYPNTMEAAIKRIIEFSERDSVDISDATNLLARIEKLHSEMKFLAAEISK